jgi:hypothetical protein
MTTKKKKNLRKAIHQRRYTNGKQTYERWPLSYPFENYKITTVKYYYISTKVAKTQNTDIPNAGQTVEQ